MDCFSVHGIFLLLSLYFAIATAETSKVNLSNITFNKSGYPASVSLPNCKKNKITLLSYRYLYRTRTGSTLEHALSAAAELTIHQMCSMKKTCDRQRFPVADLPVHESVVLEVKYRCLDEFDMFVDICDKTNKESDSTIYVILKDNLSQGICKCVLTGTFNLTLSDVRLKSSGFNNCSNAKLRVGQQSYGCTVKNDSFGSIFGRNIEEVSTVATIEYYSHSHNMKPEMVYLTISPTGTPRNANISCQPGNITSKTISKPATQILDTEKGTDFKETEEDSPGTVVVVVVICPCLVFVLVCLLVIRHKRKRRAKHELVAYLQRIIENRLDTQRPTQSTENASNVNHISTFMEEGGDYIGLEDSGATALVPGNEKHINGNSSETADSTYSYYDHLNMPHSNFVVCRETICKNSCKSSHDKQRKQDPGVYSYAVVTQPLKRKTSSSGIKQGVKADHQTKENDGAGKLSLSEDSSLHCDDNHSKKHTYVSLMPVQKSTANCDCQKSLTLPTPIHQKDTSDLLADKNKTQYPRNHGMLKNSKTSNSATIYSFATDSSGARGESSDRNIDDAECLNSSHLDSKNPVEENLLNSTVVATSRFQTHPQNEVLASAGKSSKSIESIHTSHGTKKTKGRHIFHLPASEDSRLGSILNSIKVTSKSEKRASRNKVGNNREPPLPKLHLEPPSGEAYYDIELDAQNVLDDTEYDITTRNPRLMHNASKYDNLRKPQTQGSRSIENIDIDKSVQTSMPGQFYKNVSVQGASDPKNICAQEQGPRSLALVNKGNNTKLADCPDDDHYDKVKDEFTPIQKHPNYSDLATRVRSSFLSLFKKQ